MEGLANNDRATVNKFRYKYYLANVYRLRRNGTGSIQNDFCH